MKEPKDVDGRLGIDDDGFDGDICQVNANFFIRIFFNNNNEHLLCQVWILWREWRQEDEQDDSLSND